MDPSPSYLKALSSALAKGDALRLMSEVDAAIETAGGWPLT